MLVINYTFTVLEYVNQLVRMNDLFKQRMRKLADKDRDTYEAMQWLNNNRNMFRKPVHDPILALVTC